VVIGLRALRDKPDYHVERNRQGKDEAEQQKSVG
jgi:hypothetical protein